MRGLRFLTFQVSEIRTGLFCFLNRQRTYGIGLTLPPDSQDNFKVVSARYRVMVVRRYLFKVQILVQGSG